MSLFDCFSIGQQKKQRFVCCRCCLIVSSQSVAGVTLPRILQSGQKVLRCALYSLTLFFSFLGAGAWTASLILLSCQILRVCSGKEICFSEKPCACCKGVHLWNFQTFVISLLRSFFVPSTFFSPPEMPPKRVQAGYFRGLKMVSNFG